MFGRQSRDWANQTMGRSSRPVGPNQHKLLLPLWHTICVSLILCGQREADADWPMRGGNVQNTSVSSHFGSSAPVTLAWQDVPESEWPWFYDFTTAPVVAHDGTIYVGANYHNPAPGNGCRAYCRRGELRAINPDGTLKWSRLLPKGDADQWYRHPSPMIGPDGNIYVGWAYDVWSDSVAFFAFDPDGNLLWTYDPPYPLNNFWYGGPPIMDADGTIFVTLDSNPDGNYRASLIALDSASGQPKWQFFSERRDVFFAGPALGLNGKLYYVSSSYGSSNPGTLYCLDSRTGELVWEILGVSTQDTPTVDADGSVFILNYPSTTWCTKFDENGNELWRHATGGSGSIRVASLHAGRLYLSQSGEVIVLDTSTGQRVETLTLENAVGAGRVTIDSAGNRYLLMGGALVAYSEAGELLWANNDPCCTSTPVVIGHDGLILSTARTTKSVLAGYKTDLQLPTPIRAKPKPIDP